MGGINWGDAPTWGAVLVGAVAGTAALIQLRQQGNVLKGEVQRNKRRDELLDGQLRELRQAEQFRERAQSEEVDLLWTYEDRDTSFVQVINESRRPIRRIACHGGSVDGTHSLIPADKATEMVRFPVPGGLEGGWVMPPDLTGDGEVVAMIKSGRRAGFYFGAVERDEKANCVRARFTDDAGSHWELGNDLHLTRLDNRNDW